MLADDPTRDHDMIKFRQFRRNLIGFLKLQPDVSERAFRDAISNCSVNLLKNYLTRVDRFFAESREPFKGRANLMHTVPFGRATELTPRWNP
jgi:hypothetical protein